MAAQINLFNPALRKTRATLPGARVGQGWIVAALLGLAVWAWQAWQVHQLDAEARVLDVRGQALQSEVQSLGQQLAARKPSPELRAELERKLALLQAREDVMRLLEGGEFGDTAGHARYLKAFARQWVEGLWLTGVSVTGAGADITLSGRTLDPELVPGYLARLGREEALAGHPFNRLQMRRPMQDDKPDGAPDAVPARFVEFDLATLPAATEARKP